MKALRFQIHLHVLWHTPNASISRWQARGIKLARMPTKQWLRAGCSSIKLAVRAVEWQYPRKAYLAA